MQLGPVVLGATLTKYLAEGNNGLLIDGLVELPVSAGRSDHAHRAVVRHPGPTRSYMQTWFGVTAGNRSTPAMASTICAEEDVNYRAEASPPLGTATISMAA